MLAGTAELPFGKGKRYLSDASTATDALLGGWQLNASVTVMSGLPFNVSYRDAGAGPGHRPRPSRPDRRCRPPAAGTA